MSRKGVAVALTYCGAVVGAGFATGREVVDFFTVYGRMGLLGVAVALALFIWVGTTILDITHSKEIYSYHGLLKLVLTWPPAVFIADAVFCLSLLIGAGVMTAAATAVVGGDGFSNILFGTIFLAICVLLLYRGSSGLLRANTVLVPVLVVGIIALSAVELSAPVFVLLRPGPVFAAVLYVGFNTAMAAVVLTTLGEQLDAKAARTGGWLGGIFLASMLLMVYLATSGVTNVPLPMVALAEKWLGDWAWAYKLSLLAAVLTTALANIHGLASRMSAYGAGYRPLVVGSALAALVISRLGFSSLVRVAYPLLGYCNIVLLVGLCYYKCKQRRNQ
ncbi:MAG: hypothetical protein FH749_00255 [Firmicutes bacterium]|nr:hypothetical protein [Bacillota bacterium]